MSPLFGRADRKKGRTRARHNRFTLAYRHDSLRSGRIDVAGFGPHSLRASAGTNALEHGADIAAVSEWLGHANIATTRLYDKRVVRVENSPTFRVNY